MTLLRLLSFLKVAIWLPAGVTLLWAGSAHNMEMIPLLDFSNIASAIEIIEADEAAAVQNAHDEVVWDNTVDPDQIENLLLKARTQSPLDSVPSPLNLVLRAELIDWLMDVTNEFQLEIETVLLSVHYMDCYFSFADKVAIKKAQLIGTGSLWIAHKVEDIFAVKLAKFVNLAGHSFTRSEIIEFEKDFLAKAMLGPRNWITGITVWQVLSGVLATFGALDDDAKNLAQFLACLSTFTSVFICHSVHKVASACVVLMRMQAHKNDIWPHRYENLMHYTLQEIMPLAQQLYKAWIGKERFPGLGRLFSGGRFLQVGRTVPLFHLGE